MPPLTRWFLKTSLLYLVLALLAGVLQTAAPLLGDSALARFFQGWAPIRLHLFVVGWITLLIFGVVHWMFPKFSKERPRGYEALGWAAYGLLNAGLILRVVGESAGRPGSVFGWLLVASAVLQWLGGLAFVLNAWPRVREK